MRQVLLLIFILSIISTSAQTITIADTLVENICVSVKSSTETNDSIRVVNALKTNFAILADKFSDKESDSIARLVYYRLQRNCPLFKMLLDKLIPQRGDWQQFSTLPNSTASVQDCIDFKSLSLFKYIESNGDTTDLEIKNGFWADHFKDGTFSKLKMSWITERSFKISFLESNNEKRKYYSKLGDIYYYYIINKSPGFFTICEKTENVEIYYQFKVYFK